MLLRENLAKLFPTTSSFVVFVAYTGMFGGGMLVTASRNGSSSYSYNTVTVVLLTEVMKLALATILYLKDASFLSLIEGIFKYSWVFVLYLVPAILYSLYNNLSFLSLAYLDPVTYSMFMQIRLLLTGLIYQILFKKTLSRKQWFSLTILTVGCMVHAGGASSEAEDGKDERTTNLMQLSIGCMFVLFQMLCSVCAGVYTEYLIKGKGADIHIMIQNVFMYLDSILCNVIFLGVKGDLLSAFSSSSLSSINQTFVILLIFNNAILGIITSLFLKKLNSVLKAFAAGLELVFIALISVPIFGIPFTLHTMFAICLISVAVVMYAQNPVQSKTTKDDVDQPV